MRGVPQVHLRQLFADRHGSHERACVAEPHRGFVRPRAIACVYRVRRAGDVALLSYDRSGPQGLHGTQQLKYYVGSNSRGRTFLFDIDGFLYQSPINYYAAKRIWDMSPGYTQLREMELNHPVDATCLFCHASRVQPPIEGTVNRFARDPFLQPGVGC
jgi:hypothetical protein